MKMKEKILVIENNDIESVKSVIENSNRNKSILDLNKKKDNEIILFWCVLIKIVQS